jgi:hypothetical protein
LVKDARDAFFARVDVVDDMLTRGGRIEAIDGFRAAGLPTVSVGEFCASCFAAAEAVVAVAAAGNFPGTVVGRGLAEVGDLTLLGDVGVCSFLAVTAVALVLEGVDVFSGGGCDLTCLSVCTFAASLAFCASFADSITALILAGPPLMCIFGEVGVRGEGWVTMGDLGTAFELICLVGGALIGRALSVVFSSVGGGGAGLLSLACCIFSTMVAAFDWSLSFEGEG